MGKNKNRNRRNKKKNASAEPNKKDLDVQVNISSRKANYNHSNAFAKKEISINLNCTVEFPEICPTQNKLNSLSIIDASGDCFTSASISKNCKETSIELKNVGKEEKCTGVVTGKKEYNLTRKVHPSLEVDFGKKAEPFEENRYANSRTQHFIGSNYVKKAQPKIEYNYKAKPYIENNYRIKEAQPKIEYNYKAKPYIENNYRIKETQPLVKNKHSVTTTYDEETFNAVKFRGAVPERKSIPASVPTMKGARPKTEAKFGNSTLNGNFKMKQDEKDSELFKRKIEGGVRRYESNWDNFDRLYRIWKSQRQTTIKKLQELVENVHKDQRVFNQGNAFLKELNVGSRELKNCNSSPSVDFLASLAAFVTDAASGITSVVQACNVDIYATTFKEIMENDAKITKPLHAARSRCLEEYRNVEEIIRQCHLETFGSTMDNISNTLKVEDLLSGIKNAKGENSVGQIIDSVELFLRKNANMEVMGEVYESIQGYLDSNPAALEACKSAGKALYGVYDTWGRDHKQGRASIAGNMSIISNKMLLMEERKELSKLRSVADNDQESQAKLESEIHGALSSIKREMREIDNIFEQRNQMHNSSPWYY